MAIRRSKRILASLSFFLFTICLWITKWGLEFVLDAPFPLNILFPIFTISISTAINTLFIFTLVQKPEAPNPFLKTIIDYILTVGLLVHHVYSYQSIVYWLMLTFLQIYVVMVMLILMPTEFYIIDLFIILSGSPVVQYALDKRSLWLALFSSVILGALLCLKNYFKELNNDVIVVAEHRKAETSVVQVETVVTVDVHVAGSK